VLSPVDVLALLASPHAQWSFEREHPAEHTARSVAKLALDSSLSEEGEAAFMEPVLRRLEGLPAGVPRDIVPAQRHPYWRKVMELAEGALRSVAPDWKSSHETSPAPPNPVGTWSEYFDSMLDKPVHPLYRELTPLLRPGDKVLDLASGVGQGALHLLAYGQRVWACDIHGEALAALYDRTLEELRPALHVRVMSFENLRLQPGFFDVVAAGFCLFFMSREQLGEKWPMLVDALRPGGLFMGQFLGIRDDWTAMGYTAHSREEVEAMLHGFETVVLDEVERDGRTSQGTEKYWHVFHVIARREESEPYL
jgi:SAM-dependent methyltransferase